MSGGGCRILREPKEIQAHVDHPVKPYSMQVQAGQFNQRLQKDAPPTILLSEKREHFTITIPQTGAPLPFTWKNS